MRNYTSTLAAVIAAAAILLAFPRTADARFAHYRYHRSFHHGHVGHHYVGGYHPYAYQPYNNSGALRIQVTWLPDGGWAGTDASGRLLACTESVAITPYGPAAKRFESIFPQPLGVKQRTVSFINDGSIPLRISAPRFVPVKRIVAPR